VVLALFAASIIALGAYIVFKNPYLAGAVAAAGLAFLLISLFPAPAQAAETPIQPREAREALCPPLSPIVIETWPLFAECFPQWKSR
jgi:hypothetical protein